MSSNSSKDRGRSIAEALALREREGRPVRVGLIGAGQMGTDIIVQIAEFPTDEIMDDLALETPFDLLGLFEGRGIAERWNPQTGEAPNRITLYRRAILDYWAENEETLGDIINHVLIHEIGHHFGLSDEDMARIETAAEQSHG